MREKITFLILFGILFFQTSCGQVEKSNFSYEIKFDTQGFIKEQCDPEDYVKFDLILTETKNNNPDLNGIDLIKAFCIQFKDLYPDDTFHSLFKELDEDDSYEGEEDPFLEELLILAYDEAVDHTILILQNRVKQFTSESKEDINQKTLLRGNKGMIFLEDIELDSNLITDLLNRPAVVSFYETYRSADLGYQILSRMSPLLLGKHHVIHADSELESNDFMFLTPAFLSNENEILENYSAILGYAKPKDTARINAYIREEHIVDYLVDSLGKKNSTFLWGKGSGEECSLNLINERFMGRGIFLLGDNPVLSVRQSEEYHQKFRIQFDSRSYTKEYWIQGLNRSIQNKNKIVIAIDGFVYFDIDPVQQPEVFPLLEVISPFTREEVVNGKLKMIKVLLSSSSYPVKIESIVFQSN